MANEKKVRTFNIKVAEGEGGLFDTWESQKGSNAFQRPVLRDFDEGPKK